MIEHSNPHKRGDGFRHPYKRDGEVPFAPTDGSADAARLDKLEAYLSIPINNVSAPFMGDGIWQFGHNGGDCYIIDGEGANLREAIDSLPNSD
jgi:hypothetical protein